MSTLTTFLFVFVFLLVMGAWITSELISSKTTTINKKFGKQLALLERENTKYQVSLNKENDRYTQLKQEYDQIKNAKAEIRLLNNNINKSDRKIKRFTDGFEMLRKKTSSKKYSSNSLAKEILILLDEISPTEAQIEQNKEQGTKDAFKRIKSAMGMGEGEGAEE